MKYFYFLLAIVLASSCNIIGNKIKGNGNITTKTYDLKDFKSIDAGGAMNVILKQDSLFIVKVETDENLMKYLDIEVSEGVLHIETKNGSWPDPSDGRIKIFISMPSVKSIEISGASLISTENKFTQEEKIFIDLNGASEATMDVRAPVLSLDASGASTMNITGETRDVTSDASGASTINAFDLKSENSNVEASGASSINLFASISLKANASGASHINYRGNPTVKQDASGASSVKKDN